jgi:hypothetical protein
MKTIKDKKLINQEYCEELAHWLIDNQETYFVKENEADAWQDFCYWSDRPTDRYHLVMPGEVCLIDREWNGRHAYVVCQIYGSKETQHAKDLFLVIYIDKLSRNYWKNGYFLLPDLSELKPLPTKEGKQE